jgi:uncharacterized protein DUF6884
VRRAALRLACSLCGCRTPRADCPRCGERQLTLLEKPLPIPDDAETVTLDEIAEAARREHEAEAARIAKLAGLGRTIRVGLVSCAKTKRESASPCRQLYKSPLFVLALAHAEGTCDETFVISAAHGLLRLDDTVAPYDRVLGDLPKRERLAWGNRVAGSLASRFPGLSLHISILAGLGYAAPIQRASLGHSWVIETPLARLPIGLRLAWLKERGKTRAS